MDPLNPLITRAVTSKLFHHHMEIGRLPEDGSPHLRATTMLIGHIDQGKIACQTNTRSRRAVRLAPPPNRVIHPKHPTRPLRGRRQDT